MIFHVVIKELVYFLKVQELHCPEEAASRGTIAAALLVLSSLSSKDPNASLTLLTKATDEARVQF
jgi:hypothetical protein